MKKAVFSLVVLVVLSAGGFYGWKYFQAHATVATSDVLHLNTAKAELRDIQLNVCAAGDIGPADQVSVRPEVNGKIATLPVDIGDKVKKGESLFSLDDSDLQIERSSQLSQIEGAKLQLQKAERNFIRSKKLFDDNLVSRETYDDTVTEYDLAKNTLERADKDLKLIEDRISKTKISAPFDCTVLTRPVSIGQAVSGSGGYNSGTEVLTIANLQDMIIMAHINQSDVARLTRGQHVDISVESVAGLKMAGEIERIAPQATLKNNLKGYDIRISIKTIDSRARPGMTATLSIPVSSAKGTLSIPLAAVFSEPNVDTMEMDRYVYVKIDESTYERRSIELGLTDNNYAEVIKGLKVGDVVSMEIPPADAEIKILDEPDKKEKTVATITNRNSSLSVH